MMKRVSEAEEAGLNLTWSKIPKTHFGMAWLICISCGSRVIRIFNLLKDLYRPK